MEEMKNVGAPNPGAIPAPPRDSEEFCNCPNQYMLESGEVCEICLLPTKSTFTVMDVADNLP